MILFFTCSQVQVYVFSAALSLLSFCSIGNYALHNAACRIQLSSFTETHCLLAYSLLDWLVLQLIFHSPVIVLEHPPSVYQLQHTS